MCGTHGAWHSHHRFSEAFEVPNMQRCCGLAFNETLTKLRLLRLREAFQVHKAARELETERMKNPRTRPQQTAKPTTPQSEEKKPETADEKQKDTIPVDVVATSSSEAAESTVEKACEECGEKPSSLTATKADPSPEELKSCDMKKPVKTDAQKDTKKKEDPIRLGSVAT